MEESVIQVVEGRLIIRLLEAQVLPKVQIPQVERHKLRHLIDLELVKQTQGFQGKKLFQEGISIRKSIEFIICAYPMTILLKFA